jgi:hypothetical protein
LVKKRVVGSILQRQQFGDGAVFGVYACFVPRLWPSRMYNRLTTHILAAKARGVQLGNPANLCRQLDGSAKGNAAKTIKAAKRAADLLPLILPMKADGASLRQIADGLNRCGVPAARGGDWSAVAVKRILERQV